MKRRLYEESGFCTRLIFSAAFLALLASGALTTASAAGANAAVEWNTIATQAFLTTQGTDPLGQSRTYAMVHAAIHDAVNTIYQRYGFYTPGSPPAPGRFSGGGGGGCRA